MELQELLDLVKQIQGTKSWDVTSIIQIGGVLAAKVNTLQGLTGLEKQKLVCSVIKLVLDECEKKEKEETGKTDEEKTAISERYGTLRSAVEDVLPATLELAVSAARGKLDLKKVKKSVWVQLCSCAAESAVAVMADAKLISEAQAKQVAKAIDVVEDKAMEVAVAADVAASQQTSEEKKE